MLSKSNSQTIEISNVLYSKNLENGQNRVEFSLRLNSTNFNTLRKFENNFINFWGSCRRKNKIKITK